MLAGKVESNAFRTLKAYSIHEPGTGAFPIARDKIYSKKKVCTEK
jgi:hypothetical protein